MKKILAIVLVIVMMIPTIAFGDKKWYDDYINSLNRIGIDILNNGKLHPDDSMSRKEFVEILLKQQERLFFGDMGDVETTAETCHLVDIHEFDIITWNESILRQDLAKIVANYCKEFNIEHELINSEVELDKVISDLESLQPRYTSTLEYIIGTGIMTGCGDGQFNGWKRATRAEIATVLCRVFKLTDRVKIEVQDDFSKCFGTFTTTTDRNKNRNFNINRAAEFLNETIIQPGEVFSYCKTIKYANKENGYVLSTILSGGRYVQGYGGGVCQDSTTLFNAALIANLEIVERKPHGLKATYVKPGYDATVYSGSIDFKFKNNYSTPIMIKAYFDPDNYTLTTAIYGSQKEEVPEVKLYTTGSGRSWTLYREVNGEVNYQTYSKYKN